MSEEKKKTGRKCSICTHEESEKIDAEILKGKSFRAISRQFFSNDSARDSVRRHAENCLKVDLQVYREKAVEQGRINSYVGVREEFEQLLSYAKKLRQASENVLSDPETGEISLEPRAWEVDVIYTLVDQNGDSENFTKKKEKLHVILNRLEGKLGINVHSEVKTTDIRDFALKTIDRCDLVIDKFAKLEGAYQKEKENETDEAVKKIKDSIMRRAAEKDIPFQEELQNYLNNHSQNVKPEIKEQLISNAVN